MSDRYYLTDGSHVLISGATGAGDEFGGKSVLANWWFAQSVGQGWHDLGLFYNPKGLNYVRGRTVHTLKGLAQSYRAGNRLFDYRPRSDVEAEHEAVIETLEQLPGRKIVVHDEAQSYQGSSKLNRALAQLGNMANASTPTDDIRSLVVTQRPWNLSEELRANMPLKVWVGPYGNEAEHFFNAERMAAAGEQVRANTGAYRWSVTDAGEFVETNPPVPEEFA
ncbi:hypothetical protein EXE53_16690 [Halorubrum sp. SD626R]|uniref:hypothetical protein n=1 Tax=Halorubrum sp. SD626R TaxID=1419722 RepID=UPI0010F841EB|nr:hypothetical protein [Halorubrum sp. SD626R]TKX79266.1 hypothetical protein EXE53_16690 [Halorubrum sp. SD626R]